MRNVKLHELGKACKPIEKFINSHTSYASTELELTISKMCDLKDIEVSFSTEEFEVKKDFRGSVESKGIGNIIFSSDIQSIDSLLCMHLKIEETNKQDELKLTSTHTRLFNKLCVQFSEILMGTQVDLSNVDNLTPSGRRIVMTISHNNSGIAVFNLTLDTRCLHYIRDKLEAFPDIEANRVEEALQQIPVELGCEVMNATNSLQHMLGLRVGDFLPMKKQSQASLKVNGVELYKGELMTTNNVLGIKINEQLR